MNFSIKSLLPTRRSYEERVDDVVAIINQRSFPVALFFLKDGLAIGTRKDAEGVHHATPPGVKPSSVINADFPRGLEILQETIARTPAGKVPKGVIKAAVREAWRRKFNALQVEEAARRITESQEKTQ